MATSLGGNFFTPGYAGIGSQGASANQNIQSGNTGDANLLLGNSNGAPTANDAFYNTFIAPNMAAANQASATYLDDLQQSGGSTSGMSDFLKNLNGITAPASNTYSQIGQQLQANA